MAATPPGSKTWPLPTGRLLRSSLSCLQRTRRMSPKRLPGIGRCLGFEVGRLGHQSSLLTLSVALTTVLTDWRESLKYGRRGDEYLATVLRFEETLPMDRLDRNAVALLGLIVLGLGTGCRSTKPEVPPGRGFTNDGRQIPPVGFSTDPQVPAGALATTPQPGSAMYGKGRPSTAMQNYGTPTDNSYGPPGSSKPSSGDPSVMPASGPSNLGASSGLPPELVDIPPTKAPYVPSERAIAGSAPPSPF